MSSRQQGARGGPGSSGESTRDLLTSASSPSGLAVHRSPSHFRNVHAVSPDAVHVDDAPGVGDLPAEAPRRSGSMRFMPVDSDSDESHRDRYADLDRGATPVDRDIVAAAKRGEEQNVPVEALAARMERAPADGDVPPSSPQSAAGTAHSAARSPDHPTGPTRIGRRRWSVFEDLMRAQAPMLVIELRKGAETVRYRHLRRAEILAEARKHTGRPNTRTGSVASSIQGVDLKGTVAALPSLRPSASFFSEEPGRPDMRRAVSAGTAGAARAPKQELVTSVLQSRDLRLLDSSLEMGKEPAFIVRKHCVLINLPPVRAIIMADKCFFFPEEGMDSDLIPVLERLTQLGKPRQARQTAEATAGADAEPQHHSEHDADLPFEFQVLETFLITVTSSWKARFAALYPLVSNTIHRMSRQRGGAAKLFEQLRESKKALLEFLGKLKALHRVLDELLATPEDLRSMALSHLQELEQMQQQQQQNDALFSPNEGVFPPSADVAVATADISAPTAKAVAEPEEGAWAAALVDGIALDEYEDVAEVLIESYLAELEALVTKTKLVRDELEGAESNLNLVLANNRNRLLRIEIGITAVTMCMTACSVVAGYFGMNILNNLEEDHNAFLAIVIACSGGAVLLAIILGAYFNRLLR